MNRGVLARQMFANGGQAVPNRYKGFSKLPEEVQMKMDPVAAKKYAEGGIAGMMPPPTATSPAMATQADLPIEGVDPKQLEGLLTEAQQEIGDLEEADDYETVINSIRGDELPIEDRYEELAGIVGEEDARQTPESVLALVQPAMVMGAVDQGIGGLAQAQMTEPVQGAMAQGIMSTVEPPQPTGGMGGPPPVNFKEGGLVRRGDNQPVLKFAQAGVVPGGDTSFLPYLLRNQRFTTGSDTPLLDSAMAQNMANAQNQAALEASQAAARAALSPAAAAKLPKPEPTYDERVLAAARGAEERYAAAGLGTAAERAAELESQRDLTKAQILFDVANTALAFAAPMENERPGMSAAERLAMAASTTKLPQTIGARAQTLAEQKKAADKEERALRLAAVQRGETQVDAEIAAEQAEKLARIKKTPVKADRVNLVTKNDQGGEDIVGSFDLSKPSQAAAYAKARDENPDAYPITGSPRAEREPDSDKIVMFNASTGIQSPTFDIATEQGRKDRDAWVTENQGKLPEGQSFEERERGRVPTPDRLISERDFFMKFGFSYKAFGELSPDDQAYVRGLPVVTDKDFFNKFGMLPKQFKELSESDQRYKLGLPTITDNDYFNKFGMNKKDFLAQPVEIQNRMLGIEIKPVVTKNALGQVVTVNPIDGTFKMVIDTVQPDIRANATGQLYDYSQTPPKLIDAATDPRTPKPYKVVINGKEQYVDANGPNWPKVQEKINAALKANPGSAQITNISTEVKPMGFMIADESGKTQMVLSYDNGRTYNDINGNSKKIPQGSIMVSPETTYQVYTTERSRSLAGDELTKFDAEITQSLVGQAGVTVEDLTGVKDALAMARKGTGFYANFTAFLDGASSIIPPAIKPDWVTIFGRETQQARQYLRGVTVLGRSALVVNNRFPVAEMQNVASLFPDPDALFRDPDTEALKFIDLKRAATQQYRRNLKELQKTGLDKKVAESIRANNFEIQRLLSLLPGVQLGNTQTVDDQAAIDEAQNIMSGAVSRTKQGPSKP